MASSAPNTTVMPDVEESQAILLAIAQIFMYLSTLADMFSIVSSLLSILIFNRLRNESPLFTLFLILVSTQFAAAILDTLEYVWRFFSRYGHSIPLYYDRLWMHLLYPLIYLLYLFEIWLLIVIVVERWFKHHRRESWDHLRALRWASAVFIFCLACTMTQFFERVISDYHWYHVIYGYIVLMTVSFLIPFPLNLAFSIFLAYRYVAGKSDGAANSSISHDDRQELRRTKASLFVTISFAMNNTLAYFIYFIYLIGEWSSSDYRLYQFFYELHTMLSSLNVFLGAVYCLILIPEYRRAFGAYVRMVLDKCGCAKFMSGQNREEVSGYSDLEDVENV